MTTSTTLSTTSSVSGAGSGSAVFDPLPAPTAARLRRPSWRDPRLLVGVVLVAGSVAAGAAVVGAARTTTPVFVAAHDLVPGDPVTAADLRLADVNLGGAAGRYLGAGDAPSDGSVATAVVHAGELVPRASLGSADEVDLRAVPVPVSGALSDRVRVGATVDLWYVPDAGSGAAASTGASAGTPRRLAASAVVQEVSDGSGGLVVGGDVTVQVLVPQDVLPDVLAALQGDGDVTVVPAAA